MLLLHKNCAVHHRYNKESKKSGCRDFSINQKSIINELYVSVFFEETFKNEPLTGQEVTTIWTA